jgi:hypothetical protein
LLPFFPRPSGEKVPQADEGSERQAKIPHEHREFLGSESRRRASRDFVVAVTMNGIDD